jgi:hypothetical protein
MRRRFRLNWAPRQYFNLLRGRFAAGKKQKTETKNEQKNMRNNIQHNRTTMMKIFTIALSTALATATYAAIIPFDLSPAGTGVGLSPLNEVPPVTNSVGSGAEVFDGISFDTDTALLSVAVGYGSAAGYTNLTGPATVMHIHGPAGPGTNAGVVVDLGPFSFLAANPTNGGIIFGTVPIPTNEVANLLAGLHYLNIHTATNPAGELRAQLVPLLENPPVVTCPAPVTVECGSVTTVTVQVSDPDNDALLVVWSVNGTSLQTNQLASGSTAAPTPVSFDAEYQLGTNVISIVVADSTNTSVECSTTVTVVDTTPPVVTTLTSNPNSLWPPNHKLVAIRLAATVTDLCGGTTWKITSITSSEPEDAKGSGNTAPDWEITGNHTAKLRAERSGITGPRVYTLTVEAEDAAGNVSAPKTVTVTVPHSKGK